VVIKIGLILVVLVGLGLAWRFARLKQQIISDRQHYHRTMLPQQIRASRRFFYRTEIKQSPRLRWLMRLERVGLIAVVIGIGLPWIVTPAPTPVVIVGMVGLLIGSVVFASCNMLLNRQLLATTVVPDQPATASLSVTPKHFADQELRYFKVLNGLFLIAAILGALLMLGLVQNNEAVQRTKVVTKVSAANQNVRQIQRLAVGSQRLSSRAKMTLFSMYYNDITNKDLDTGSRYTYHVIHDQTVTWYVLMQDSEDDGVSFYYLVKEDGQHQIQLYRFNDPTGDKTALHGLVPAYTPYYQTKVKLGQLTTAFMTQKGYQYMIKKMHPGKAWTF